MKTKNKFFLGIILVFIAITVYLFMNKTFSSSLDKDLTKEIAAVNINSKELIAAYQLNEEKSNTLYAGKIIEVTGNIKEITFLNNRNTVILKSKSEKFGIICDINPNEKGKIKKLEINQKIRVKGICKGFLKDVILLNCTIDLLTNE